MNEDQDPRDRPTEGGRPRDNERPNPSGHIGERKSDQDRLRKGSEIPPPPPPKPKKD